LALWGVIACASAFLFLIDTAKRRGMLAATVARDKGYDVGPVYEDCAERDCLPIIPLRETGAVKHLPPECKHGTWKFAGSDRKRGASKWRCPTGTRLPRLPINPVKKIGGLDVKRRCELDQRVDADRPGPSLHHPYVGSMERGTDRKILLGHPSPPTAAGQVFAEPLSDIHVEEIQSKRSAATVGATIPPEQCNSPTPVRSRMARS
jgi:hypothetical protein